MYFKHGLSTGKKDRIYRIWQKMKSRCYCTTNDSYHRYGGRGISICDEWLKDFLVFRTWSLNNGYRNDLSIDRIDNNGNYCPENCRWANNFVQMRNTRQNHLLTAFGETKCIVEWLEDSRCKVVDATTLSERVLRYKWEHETAIITPPQKFKDIKSKYAQKYLHNGESKTIREWSQDKRCVVKLRTLQHRLQIGWDIKNALLLTPQSGKDYFLRK